MTIRIKSLALLIGALGVLAPQSWAVSFEVSIPQGNAVFTPGGTTTLPPARVSALRPITFRTTPAGVTFLQAGEVISLRVAVTYDDDHSEDITLSPETKYRSSNPNAFVVSNSGVVTAVGAGAGKILVEHRGEIWPITASVVTEAIVALTPVFNRHLRYEFDSNPDPSSIVSISPGESATLDVSAILSDGRQVMITGNSSLLTTSEDVSIASVNAAGTSLSAVGFGTTTIRLESHGISTFAVVQVNPPDVTPPVTNIHFIPDSFVGTAGRVFLSTRTEIFLPATDPLSGAAYVSGINFTGHTTDPILSDIWAFESYFAQEGELPFSLEEGNFILRYGSNDKANNFEAIQSTTIFVDGTAPVTHLEVIGFSTTDILGRLHLSTSAQVDFGGNDPISSGAASGLSEILFATDGNNPSIVSCS